MNPPYYYFSLQYSAIQKTILRHDRLWSISGISQKLAQLNEVDLPQIVENKQGLTIVAGGGKFIARFEDDEHGQKARREIIKTISTQLPMLEFQASEIIPADNFEEAKNDKKIIDGLNEQRRNFRGYGVTFNPHIMVCEECGEYPAVKKVRFPDKKERFLCTVCKMARECSRIDLESLKKKGVHNAPTIIKIYKRYLDGLQSNEMLEIALDFDDLFPAKQDEDENTNKANRMAVWFSDINSMNDKVPIWLTQPEDKVRKIFDKVKEVNINAISDALIDTFPHTGHGYLPFRLIVAGGDDLCIVMDSQYILDFCLNLSSKIEAEIDRLTEVHPLHHVWLKKHSNEIVKEPKQYSFGSSFVVTSVHTPFKKIHEVGEELMSRAKHETERQGNSVNWCVAADEETVSDEILRFEKPLFIEFPPPENAEDHLKERLVFSKYVELVKEFSNISLSHIHQIITILIDNKGDSSKARTELIKHAQKDSDKDFSQVLERFDNNGCIDSARIATLFELITIGRKK